MHDVSHAVVNTPVGVYVVQLLCVVLTLAATFAILFVLLRILRRLSAPHR